MAEKRMYSKKITDSDDFIELSSSAQALYFHLNQGADDDGFNNQIQIAMLKAHSTIDDIKVLMAKNFIIRFETGVIVIKHWRMHNILRKDRYMETNFKREFSMLKIDENGTYEMSGTDERLPNGCQVVAKWLPQIRLEERREEEISIPPLCNIPPKGAFTPPTVEEVTEYCRERDNGVDAQRFVDFYESKGWKVGKNSMKDWKACVRAWEKTEKPKPTKRAHDRKYDREE